MNKYFVALAAAVAIGCTHRSNDGDELATGCGGRRDVVVINNWTEPVEVFTRVGASPDQFIGTVAAGRRDQFHLPAGARFASVRPTGSTARDGGMPASSRDLVDLRYLCE